MYSSFLFLFLVLSSFLFSSSSFISAACTIPSGDYSSCDLTSTSTYCTCTALTNEGCVTRYYGTQNPVPSLYVTSRNQCEVPQSCDSSTQKLNSNTNTCESLNVEETPSPASSSSSSNDDISIFSF